MTQSIALLEAPLCPLSRFARAEPGRTGWFPGAEMNRTSKVVEAVVR